MTARPRVAVCRACAACRRRGPPDGNHFCLLVVTGIRLWFCHPERSSVAAWSKDLPASASQARFSSSTCFVKPAVSPAAEAPSTALRCAQDDKAWKIVLHYPRTKDVAAQRMLDPPRSAVLRLNRQKAKSSSDEAANLCPPHCKFFVTRRVKADPFRPWSPASFPLKHRSRRRAANQRKGTRLCRQPPSRCSAIHWQRRSASSRNADRFSQAG